MTETESPNKLESFSFSDFKGTPSIVFFREILTRFVLSRLTKVDIFV